MLASRESEHLAERLIRETVVKQGVARGRLTLHSDRGPSMRSQTVAQLLATLGITKSHSRPHVSDDNPFSESQFKTMKYQPDFPDRFTGIEQGLEFCGKFIHWQNHEHHHWGLGLLTPAMVHYGQAAAVLAARQTVLTAAYAVHPERFVGHPLAFSHVHAARSGSIRCLAGRSPLSAGCEVPCRSGDPVRHRNDRSRCHGRDADVLDTLRRSVHRCHKWCVALASGAGCTVGDGGRPMTNNDAFEVGS